MFDLNGALGPDHGLYVRRGMASSDRSPWSYVLPLAVALALGSALAYFAVTSIMAFQVRAALTQHEQPKAVSRKAGGRQQPALHPRSLRSDSRRPGGLVDRRPAYPTGSDDMPDGSKSCMYGYVNIREGGRWRQLNRRGQAIPCRVAVR